jgi:formylglycine-generating enzyme required for sulfatase activity
MTLAYLDFQIEVTAVAAPRYRIAVRSQAGDTHAEIDFPFTDAQLQVELQRLEHAILYARLGTRGRLTAHEEAVRDFGLRFFDFLLPPGDARSLYYECRRVAEFEGKGVRVKLLMHAPQLAAMPWEFLFDPRRRDYLALDPYTPIVRYPELAQRTTPLLVTPPLRILGVIANPTDLPRLDVERERQQVEAAIRPLVDQSRVQLTWLPGQSWRDLQQWMRPGYGPWHIFHFIGHGEFDQRRDEGRLFLADEQGKAQAISATQLNRLLAFQRGTLRLALLNACEGARGGKFDVLSSTAATLVLGGLPAVLAMQYAITDSAALEFARTFYGALADNLPVDAAVADARNAINLQDEYSLEWGTPVLFMRTADGQLFTVDQTARPSTAPGQPIVEQHTSAPPPKQIDTQPKPAPAEQQRKSASVPAPKAGDKRTISAAGVDFTFVYVPAGPFIMGSEDGYADEKPMFTYQTDAFWLLQTPVTNAHYGPFVEAGGYNKQAWWTPTGWQWRTKEKLTEPRYWKDNKWNEAKQPVVGVSWYEALAFANWLAQTTGEAIRLPTEAEWEKGARGEKGLKYPWGDQAPTDELCNFNGKIGKTTPVDRYPKGASPYDALDMAGNVWEWTATKWLENYVNYATLVDNNPEADASARRVVRGGAWGDDRDLVRAAYRNRYTPDDRYFYLGFRVVVSVAPQKGF